jgi:hypothetical protein
VPDPKYSFPGSFLDLRTLTFALTAESHSLASACELFGIEDAKLEIEQHGVITPENIDYNRHDVHSTALLAERALVEYARHPIALSPTSAYSPASIGKAYLDAMGVHQLRERERRFPRKRHGHAMTAYYGGRADCRIRKTLVPVVTVDFLSNYPTGNALMNVWQLVSADRIKAVPATSEVRDFLSKLTLEACFEPATWRELPALCLVEPNGEVLPARCEYGQNGSWQIGLNPLTSRTPLWYPLPDLVSSWLLAGRAPRVIRAFRLTPEGRQEGLTPVGLRGEVGIDPIGSDPFRRLIEERKRLDQRDELPERERKSLERSFKVVANSIGYGVFAEISRTDSGSQTHDVNVYGLEAPFKLKLSAVEEPGRYSFPPIAALVTAAGRLQLALLERLVADLGGSYVYCDTDSVAIVATKPGGTVECHTKNGETINALSWQQVDEIVDRFESLNPYDRKAIPGSILQIEKRNSDEKGTRRQLYANSISAKRYALATKEQDGHFKIVKRSEHGLGHLRNPISTDPDDRDWFTPFWHTILNPHTQDSPQDWQGRPAVSQITASSPAVLRVFDGYNDGRPYREQIKPFNFLIASYVAPFGHPAGYSPERFQLIAPYQPDPSQWERMPWIDRYSGDNFPVHTEGPPQADSVKLRTYQDIQDRYLRHPEPKSLDPDGTVCRPDSTGLLQRRPVTAVEPIYLGKESNNLEERQAGLIHQFSDAFAIYPDPGADTWQRIVLPALRQFPAVEIARRSGLHRRTVERHLSGRSAPHPRHRAALTHVASELAAEVLQDLKLQAPRDAVARLSLFLQKTR